MARLALEDVRVLDLTHHLCGPYATKLMADYGADVIKIERPDTGDPARYLAPFKDDEPHPEKSGIFAYLNTNKRSVTLDLASTDGTAAFLELLDGADIVVENFRPGVMDRLGLGFDALSARRPGIVLLSISNFGQSGPYRDWAGSELVLYAMGGEMYSTGLAEREPIKLAGTAALMQSAAAAAAAGMAGIYNAKWRGAGEHLDIAIYETQIGNVDRRVGAIMAYQFSGRVSERVPAGATLGYPSGVYPCADGYVEINGVGPRWPSLVRMLGSPPELAGPEWLSSEFSRLPESLATFEQVFLPWLLSRTKREVWAQAQAAHVLCAPLYTMEDLFSDPVFRQRGFLIEVERPHLGQFTMPGRPFRMPATPWALRRPAPLLGEHTAAVLADLPQGRAWSPRPIPTTMPAAPIAGPAFRPLADVRVVEISVVWAGPYGAMLLGDLGADVVKVENVHVWVPNTRGLFAHPPQSMMGAGPAWATGYPDNEPGERPWNRAPSIITMLRNKRSVTMDLHVPEGRRAFEDLVRTADVVFENNVPETMDKLGLTYDYLRALRPDIIYTRMPGFGLDGPYRDYRAYGIHMESVTGHNLLRKYPDLDVSTNGVVQAGDYFNATHAVFATIAALHHRNRTGEGQLIELAQAEGATGMLPQYLIDYALNRRNGEAIGNRDYHGAAPAGVYPCRPSAGDSGHPGDRWLALTICDDAAWTALCNALGHHEWTADVRFATAAGRRAHHDEIDRLLAEETRCREVWELTRALQACGVAAGPVMDARDANVDPHLWARGIFQRLPHADCGVRDWIGPWMRTGAGPLPIRRPPVTLGEDNAFVYKDLLGCNDAVYDALVAAGHIGDRYDDDIP